jgi:hypothetical protein
LKLERPRFSRRALAIIVSSQVVLVGLIFGAVFASALDASPQKSSKISATSDPQIVGEIVIATPSPSAVPAPVESTEPEPSADIGSEPRVGNPSQGNGNGCQLAMEEIRRTVEALTASSNAAMEQMYNYNYEGLDPDEQQSVQDGFQAQIDGFQAQISAYYASLGIDPFKGYGCGGDGVPATF